MKKTVAQFMEEDHDKLDAIFKEFKSQKRTDPRKARRAFHDFKIRLQRHIVWEEEILFPLFEDKTGRHQAGPTAVMRQEHRTIKGLLEKIHMNILKDDSLTSIAEDRLKEILAEHNYKEENMLYPWIDNSCSEAEREAVFTKMENVPPQRYSKCCE